MVQTLNLNNLTQSYHYVSGYLSRKPPGYIRYPGKMQI